MTEREIFQAALELPDPTDRSAFLDRACGDNLHLRAEVSALLQSHAAAGSFLGQPLVEPPDEDHATTRAYVGTAPVTPDEPITFLAPPSRPDSLGRIGHYEVLQLLGRGAFGIVFRAFDDILQRVVAVKVLAPELAATSPARKRFLREARTSAQVRHENVVQVYEVGEQPLPYLVMEFIPGETLQQRLDRTGPVDPAEVLRVGRQIAEGLAAAHATDLIHRDIKPGNVLIEGGQLRVKITDFGLARAADDASISQSGIVAGTPMYMAPEQALGMTIDQRADLFSLGSVLYQMTTGRPPFRANSTLSVMKRVAEDAPRPIREIIPETPSWLCDIIQKLHEKEPDDRFQSAREVADLLAECETRLKANVRSREFPRIAPRRTKASGRGAWATSVVAVVVAVAAGIAYALTRPLAPSVTEPVTLATTHSPIANTVPTNPLVQKGSILTANEQVEAIREELKRLNPNYDGSLTPQFEYGEVVGLELSTLDVADITAVQALTKLKRLVCTGQDGSGKVVDLVPLKGLPLTTLDCNNNRVVDLSPLKATPLKQLYCQHTAIRDLTPLAGMLLEQLNCSHTLVADLTALKGMPLIALYLDNTKVADLTPLKGMPLKRVNLRNLTLQPERDGAVLRSLTQLEEINGEAPDVFLKELEGKDEE